MDGVLIDSEPLHFEALRSVLAREGHEWTWDDNEHILGTTVLDTFRIISQSVPLAEPIEGYIPAYDAEVLEILSGPLTAAPGVSDLMARLKELGVPLAVASSSLRSWVEATIGSLKLMEYFDVIVAGDEIENGKP